MAFQDKTVGTGKTYTTLALFETAAESAHTTADPWRALCTGAVGTVILSDFTDTGGTTAAEALTVTFDTGQKHNGTFGSGGASISYNGASVIGISKTSNGPGALHVKGIEFIAGATGGSKIGIYTRLSSPDQHFVRIEDNLFDLRTGNNNDNQGIFLETRDGASGGAGSNGHIINNFMRGIVEQFINIRCTTSGGFSRTHNAFVFHNDMVPEDATHCDYGIFIHRNGAAARTATINLQAQNNTVTGTATSIAHYAKQDDNTVAGTLDTNGNISGDATSTFIEAGSPANKINVADTDIYTNPGAADYTKLSSGPHINAGFDLTGVVDLDWKGTSRDSTPTIGWEEVVAAPAAGLLEREYPRGLNRGVLRGVA